MPEPPAWLMWIVVILVMGEIAVFFLQIIYTVVKHYLWERRNVIKETR